MHAVEASLPRIIEELAKEDDRKFSIIEELLERSQYDDGDRILDQKDKLCAALASFSIDSIKCRLARTYLESVWSTQNENGTISLEDNTSELTLKAELDSLYDEIIPVTQMWIGVCF